MAGFLSMGGVETGEMREAICCLIRHSRGSVRARVEEEAGDRSSHQARVQAAFLMM